ncbi:MAG: TetR/AcrR family transcriptional regulator [Sandaracinaceae bacterium]
MKKGEKTRAAILQDALSLASRIGLEGLTIGSLAKRNGMSKSGLFAHFASKEGLQIQVLEAARVRFVRAVVSPALRQPRGEARVRALFDGWLAWSESELLPGGCPLVSAACELDDRPGGARDALVSIQRDWFDTLQHAVRTAVEEGQFAATVDPADWAFELWGIALAYHHHRRLMRDPNAAARARRAFARQLEHARLVLE